MHVMNASSKRRGGQARVPFTHGLQCLVLLRYRVVINPAKHVLLQHLQLCTHSVGGGKHCPVRAQHCQRLRKMSIRDHSNQGKTMIVQQESECLYWRPSGSGSAHASLPRTRAWGWQRSAVHQNNGNGYAFDRGAWVGGGGVERGGVGWGAIDHWCEKNNTVCFFAKSSASSQVSKVTSLP